MVLGSQKILITIWFQKFYRRYFIIYLQQTRCDCAISVYVDDIVLTKNSISFINIFVSQLDKTFSFKDL